MRIRQDDPAAARHWLKGLSAAAARLADYPDIGQVVSKSSPEVQREMLYGQYRVRYRVGKVVTVVAVMHMSRQVTALDESDP